MGRVLVSLPGQSASIGSAPARRTRTRFEGHFHLREDGQAVAAGEQEGSGPKDLLFRMDLASGVLAEKVSIPATVGSGGGASSSRTPRQDLQERLKPSGADSREFELPGRDAIVRKEGDRLIIEPTPPKSLLALLATCAAPRRRVSDNSRAGASIPSSFDALPARYQHPPGPRAATRGSWNASSSEGGKPLW